MHIPVHSPWLPGYIDFMQTILIILTIAGLFPDRPHRIMGKLYIYTQHTYVIYNTDILMHIYSNVYMSIDIMYNAYIY